MFRVDVSSLMLGQNFRASQVPIPEKIRLVSNPDTVIAHVVAIRAVVEATEATAEGAAPAVAEPEVIKKGKKEEEGAAAGEKEGKEKEKEKKK